MKALLHVESTNLASADAAVGAVIVAANNAASVQRQLIASETSAGGSSNLSTLDATCAQAGRGSPTCAEAISAASKANVANETAFQVEIAQAAKEESSDSIKERAGMSSAAAAFGDAAVALAGIAFPRSAIADARQLRRDLVTVSSRAGELSAVIGDAVSESFAMAGFNSAEQSVRVDVATLHHDLGMAPPS